ncbi:SH3 domain-containing protein [Paenibacillus thiaminolyticus]|uniref:SH3 domain-containing protein n=1 Tax=Paenibacillus thiaminolyticus TaxID=49283 RepID=UPI00232E8324|nr:SH3 domain-containing protein [Paenibacillus thiaminolyticus]WCF06733.1 SH3 domain-containing protein [Paenibacillus thiaminolyticus]
MFKKAAILSMAIASTVVMAQGAYAAENKVPANVNNQQQAVTGEDRIVLFSPSYEVISDGVRLRTSPSLSGTTIGLLYKGDVVGSWYDAVENPVYADGYWWVNVHSHRHNASGWVALQYLSGP